MTLSPQAQQQIRELLETAKNELDAKAEELLKQPGNDEAKKETATKIGLLTGLLQQYRLGVPPTPEQAQEAFEHLEENINIFIRIFRALVGVGKAVIEGIVTLLMATRDGILSFFPKQTTETAYIPDRELRGEGVVTFAMVSDMEATGLLVIPAAFAGTASELRIPYSPSQSTFSVRVQPVSPSRACLRIESLASVSQDIEHEGLRLPPFLQSLDPRRPSIGVLDLETGEVSGRMYSRLIDGVLYTVRSPVLVRSTFTGRMHFDSGILRMRTEAIDFAGDLPLRRVSRPRLSLDRTVLLREGLSERFAVAPRINPPIVPG